MLTALKNHVRYYARGVRDFAENRGRATGERRILFIRHPRQKLDYYHSFLQWLAETIPEVYATCEVRSLPFMPRDWSPYGVVMSWIGDSSLALGRWELNAMREMEARLATNEIRSVNTAAATLGSCKCAGAQAMARAGLRTPRIELIRDIDRFRRDPGDFPFPMLIRENYGHAGRTPMLCLRDADALRGAELAPFQHPIAVEFVDVREPNGYCRRYRYVAARDFGLSFNLHISKSWEVRGDVRIRGEYPMMEERAFVGRPNPHHEEFQAARRAMGLGFVGFDYSYDPQGKLVTWEANSLPGTGLGYNSDRRHQEDVNRTTFAAMTRMLLLLAGRPVPEYVDHVLQNSPSASGPRSNAA